MVWLLWCAFVALQRGISAGLYFSAGFVENRKWAWFSFVSFININSIHALLSHSGITTGVRIETHFMHCAFQQQPLQWLRYFSLEFSWMLRQSWKESFCVALLKLSNAWAYVCLVSQNELSPPIMQNFDSQLQRPTMLKKNSMHTCALKWPRLMRHFLTVWGNHF